MFTGDIISCVLALDNLNQKSKKRMANDKLELLKTGGGTFVWQVTHIDEKVLELLGHRATSLVNPHDADSSETGYSVVCNFSFCVNGTTFSVIQTRVTKKCNAGMHSCNYSLFFYFV